MKKKTKPARRRVIAEHGKVPLDLLLMPCLNEVALVLQHGNIKPGRGAFNWRANQVLKSNMVAGALRHIMRDGNGQSRDPASRQRELAHAVARLLIAMDAEDHRRLVKGYQRKGKRT